jgi:acyl-CoA synthetase (AMP-forming)/AMP-acid ligase II
MRDASGADESSAGLPPPCQQGIEQAIDEASTLERLLSLRALLSHDTPFLQEWSSGQGITLTLSFAELSSRVAEAVVNLAGRDVDCGDRVALLSHPTLPCFVHAYAVMAMGGACTLLNWRQPANVVAEMICNSSCVVLLLSDAFEPQVRHLRHRCTIALYPPNPLLLFRR